MAQAHATQADVSRVLEIVESARAVDGSEIFYSDVLRGLAELVPSDDITFQLMDIPRETYELFSLAGGTIVVTNDRQEREQDPEEYARWWDAYWACDRAGWHLPDHGRVVRRTDHYSDREYRATAIGQLMAGWGVRYDICACLPPYGGLDLSFGLFRASGLDFTDREVEIVKLIRPHLGELHMRRQRELSGEPELTPRQWQILRQVSLGSSNAQIGRALGVSEATVRKHLENIFLRLRAVSRTEAVRKVSGYL